jgi:hypothetical protein
MAELRIEIPNDDDDLQVLDAYCSANPQKNRTSVMRDLLKVWSQNKLHEATLIMRVTGGNPTRSESDSDRIGK